MGGRPSAANPLVSQPVMGRESADVPGRRLFLKSLMVGIGSLFLSVGSNLAFAHAAGKSDLEYLRFREELHRLVKSQDVV